ncbi:MAG: DUF5667 domain-containing protein [Candidatus Doudnabacteria bacterium]
MKKLSPYNFNNSQPKPLSESAFESSFESIIIEQSLEQISQGQAPATILAQYQDQLSSEQHAELADILDTVNLLTSIKTKTPPTPLKQHKYAELRANKWRFAQLLNFTKYAAIPLVLAIAFTGSRSLIYATDQSLPGETLFSLKRATEKARVSLTFDKEHAAQLEAQITQKRLEETKKVLAESNDPEQKALAIAELTTQTQKAFDSAADIIPSEALKEGDSDLLKTLVAINKEQKNLSATSIELEDAESLASSTKENDKTIAKLVATVNEQSLADLPNKVSVTGEVTSKNSSYITVESNTFKLNDQTTLLNYDGEATSLENIEGKITIIGTSENNQLVAKKILITETQNAEPQTTSTNPEVKGAKTPSYYPKPQPKATTQEPEDEPTIEPEVILPTQNEATAGFIVEPAQKQYAP